MTRTILDMDDNRQTDAIEIPEAELDLKDLAFARHKFSAAIAQATANEAMWTCPGKVESFPEVKGELDDEAATVYKGIRGRSGPAGGDQRAHTA